MNGPTLLNGLSQSFQSLYQYRMDAIGKTAVGINAAIHPAQKDCVLRFQSPLIYSPMDVVC